MSMEMASIYVAVKVVGVEKVVRTEGLRVYDAAGEISGNDK